MTETRRVLVTGGAGFVGATLVRRLVDSGHAVRVLDNFTTPVTPRTSKASTRSSSKVTYATPGPWDEALGGIESVVHLAAAGSVVMSVADPAANFNVNVFGTFQVLDAARRAGVERTVLASTGGALIGDAVPPVNELSLPKPISPYGASKLAGEGYAHAFAKAYGLRTIALRFANAYGPWSERKRGAVTTFFRAINSGEPIVIFGDGRASRDYTHVDDICHALELALSSEVPGGTVLHIASGVETTVNELAALCCRAAGVADHPIEYRQSASGRSSGICLLRLAKQVLGYEPSISREVGMCRTCSGSRSRSSPIAEVSSGVPRGGYYTVWTV